MWRKLFRQSPRRWLEFGEAQFWVIWAFVAVRLIPRGRLVSPAVETSRAPGPGTFGSKPTINRLVRANLQVCRHGLVRAECLVRSIALQKMLSAHGVMDTCVCFGVRSHEGELQSHAWVEWRGRVIADNPGHVRTFTKLDGISIPGSIELS